MRVKNMTCPHCRTSLQIGEYKHAADLSLLCERCGKVIFPINQQQEDMIPKNVGKNRVNQHPSWENDYH